MEARYMYNHPSLSDPDYRKYKEMIDRSGHIALNRDTDKVRIYDPFMFMILTTVDLPVRNLETNEDTTINGFDLLPIFIQGYNEGREHFAKEFEVTPDTLYKNPAYIETLLKNYNGDLRKRGWKMVRWSHPMIFDNESIREFGFNSGIASKFDELKEKHSVLFTAVDQKPEQIKKIKQLRLPAAFCFCLLFKAGKLLYKGKKFDLSTMSVTYLKNFIKSNIPDVSPQKIAHTLLGYLKEYPDEEGILFYNKHKQWVWREDNYNLMKIRFPEAFESGQNLFNNLP